MQHQKKPNGEGTKNPLQSAHHLVIGKQGETLALKYLVSKGYKVVAKNIRTPFGEIDVLATKNGVYRFIEVKTRTTLKYGKPYEAVNSAKKEKIAKSIEYICKSMNLSEVRLAFDVLSIEIDTQRSIANFKLYDTLEIT